MPGVIAKHSEPPLRILFVCMGNTCRSPMAEVMLRHNAVRRGLHISVASAGVRCGNPGGPANDHAVAAMQARGMDLSTHTQRRFDDAKVGWYDMIVALDVDVRDAIIQQSPDAHGRLYVLGQGVPDPYEQGPDAYQRAVDLIASGIEGLLASSAMQACQSSSS